METNDELDPNTKRKINQDTKDQKNAKRRKTYAKNKENIYYYKKFDKL